MSAETENAENVLQQIFIECDGTVVTLTGDADRVPISRIVEYIREQLLNWSLMHSSKKKTMNIDKDIMESELREKLQELREQNVDLQDELGRHEASIVSLKQQHSSTEKQLKHYIKKCQELEKENDEQREQLNELIEKKKTMVLALQRYMKEHQNLLKQLETVEIEVQAIPPLKEKLDRIIKEKMECMKLIDKMQEEFDEKKDNCEQLKATIIQLENMSINMKESYEYTIHSLREKNRLLTSENIELQSLSSFNVCPVSGEKLSISPIPDTDGNYMHSTPYKWMKISMQDSLYTELKASGFTTECSRSDREDLEEELNEYDAAICVILEQLEKVIQFFVTMRGSTDDLSDFNSQDTDARAYNINALKRKADFLLYMATEEITRRDARRDSNTQLRADSANQWLSELGIRSFWNSPMYVQPKAETSLRPIASHDVNNEDDDLFLKVIKTYTASQNHTIEPMALVTSEKENGETNAENFQETSSASNLTSPRRKLSVYCRSFDVVAVQDRHEDQSGSNLEVRELPSNPDSPAQVDRIAAEARNSTPNAKYLFNHVYRNAESDSDSSSSTPRKFQDSLLDDESPVEKPIPRKVRLAPTRLRFSRETGNDLDRTVEASNCASFSLVNSTELVISDICPLSPIGEHKEDDAPIYLSTFANKRKMEVKNVVPKSKSYSNENGPQAHPMPNRPHAQADSAKITDSEDPHSPASVQSLDSESQSRIERSVDNQMSSCEDSLTVSGNEREPGSGNQSEIDEKVEKANEVGKTVDIVSSTSVADPISTKVTPCNNVASNGEKTPQRNLTSNTKQEIRQWLLNRSYSEGEILTRLKYSCRCRGKNIPSTSENNQRRVFPSLTDVRLKESGIANLSDLEESREKLSELELQKKYTAFSLCLSTDRLTLPRRIAMACRQRDQSERNFACEVQKMQQDIQELAPLCTDRESVERVERVRHQLDMIVRCAHRVSCAAETLGAVHQERRVSRAVFLADKYLQVLHSRCEKLIANVAETKRILVENNIVVEENSGELNDELPRIRYRSGTPANNRMMMARRRASVATMSRPLNTVQDVIKEAVRQRNSVSGRMTLRKPSFSSESPKWENEKLDRTESSNSISELRGIFEQAESRRSSKEENNNMLRSGQSNSQSTVNCASNNDEVFTNVKEEISPELSDNESINSDRLSARSSQDHPFQLRRRMSICCEILLSTLIFCFVFYVIQVVFFTVAGPCKEPLTERFYSCVYNKYRQTRDTAPHPM